MKAEREDGERKDETMDEVTMLALTVNTRRDNVAIAPTDGVREGAAEMESGTTEGPMDRQADKEAHKEALAAEADERIKRGAHWEDWCFVADGFAVGRAKAMRAAGTNRPFGSPYTRAFKNWMAERPWAKNCDNATRAHLLWVADNRSEIEAWRAKLAQNERDKMNHPTTLRRKYDAAHKVAAKDPNAPKKETSRETLARENAVLWDKIKKLERRVADGVEEQLDDRRLAKWAKALAKAGFKMDEDDDGVYLVAADRKKFDAWVAAEQAGFEDADNKTYYPNPSLLEAARRERGIGVEVERKRVAKATSRSSRRAAPSPAQPVAVEAPKPAVPVKNSITSNSIVCLEDGREFKSLTRHLRTQYNLSPEDYREKWGLPSDYPMTVQAHAKAPR